MSQILDQVNGPPDVKRLSREELERLAQEIREQLVATVTANGGHLASNLGVVELTIALHRVFDSPRDKIIWDVGHQSYVHKLLTGRRQDFHTLRQYGGLSGFTDRDESPHDPFGAGHASTSISAALGMGVARDLQGEDYQVVAVIGDGAIGGGMAFEALNQAGHLGSRIIVILNDNGMAISPSVGALARFLNRIQLDRRYHWAKKEAQQMMAYLPWGKRAWEVARRLKDGLVDMVLPRILWWEELGFRYIGPVDGHNLTELERILSRARNYADGPILIHVITTKGKGYAPAELDAIHFHGLSPEDQSAQSTSYSQIFAETVLRLAQENPRVVAVTAAMPEGTGLNLVSQQLPDRVFDVGICEQHAVTFAAGLATQGFIPIVAIYSTFLQRAFDQVVHDVCVQNLPVVFAMDRSGIVGEDGKTHQGSFDLSYLNPIPNLVVAAPKDENELRHLLFTAVNSHRPMAIRYPRGSTLGVTLEPAFKELPLGRGEVLREGLDLAFIAIGAMVAPAMEAAQRLSTEGIEATVINARFLKPLDSSLIQQAAQAARRLVTVEENALAGGLGSAILQLLHGSGVEGIQTLSIGLPDEFVEQGPPSLLRSRYGLDAEGIRQRVMVAFPELALRQKAASTQ
ncbi:MAG: 1-deoxy-D-xylulose-5-phosphate synthase [Dehalococcoidia bacterium]